MKKTTHNKKCKRKPKLKNQNKKQIIKFKEFSYVFIFIHFEKSEQETNNIKFKEFLHVFILKNEKINQL